MNLQIDDSSIFYDIWNHEEDSTSWYAQTIHTIAFSRMQHIWIIFIDGVKSLYAFAVCLNEPILNQRRLQELSQNVQTKISLAQQNIASGENYVKAEIDRLLLQRQEKEKNIEELNKKIKSLTDLTQEKEKEEREATEQVKNAEKEVGKHTNQVEGTKEGATFFAGGTAVMGLSAFFSGGVIPLVTSIWFVASTLTLHICLDNEKKDLELKENTLKIQKTGLKETQSRLTKIKKELVEKKIELNNLDVQRENLLNELTQLTQLKTSTTKFNDYINVTLGRVEFLNERRKIERARENLKEVIEELVEHLSNFRSFESNSYITQILESFALHIKSNAEYKGSDSFNTCYDNSCSAFCCCFRSLCYALRRSFCCLDGFRL